MLLFTIFFIRFISYVCCFLGFRWDFVILEYLGFEYIVGLLEEGLSVRLGVIVFLVGIVWVNEGR